MTTTSTDRPKGTGPFYLVAIAATAVSVDTSWRFFGDVLRITNKIERGAMFAVLELALVACGYAMRHNVRRPGGTPGAARILAWALCGLSAYMALALSGPVAGLARVALGPVLALVALHLALGIEIRVHHQRAAGAWGRVVAELRERVMSRLGLGDDERKAAERTRDRARERAARLATATGWVPRRTQRLVKAVRQSGATLDPDQRGRLVEQVAVLKNITDLTNVTVESPWNAAVPPHVQRIVDAAQRSIEVQRAAADRDAAAVLADAERAATALREAVQRDADAALRRTEAQHREALQRVAAAQAEAAQIRAAADKVAAEERRAADDHRRYVEQQAQQQYEQLMAAARAEAAEIRSGARSDAQVPRPTVNRSIERRITTAAPQRSNGRGATPIEVLVDALAQQWPDEIPSERAATKFLRPTFDGCSDARGKEAVAALRVRRGAAPDAADAERLQVTAAPINGTNHRILEPTS